MKDERHAVVRSAILYVTAKNGILLAKSPSCLHRIVTNIPYNSTCFTLSAQMDSSEWDRFAESYAANCTSFCAAHAQDVVTTLSRVLTSERSLTIVDVGCGSGAFELAYLRRFPRGVPGHTFICVDVSPAMIKQAKQAVANTVSDQSLTKFQFHVDDATVLKNIPDRCANVVVSMFCAFLIPDQKAVFDNIKRILVDHDASVFASAAWTPLPPELTDAGFGVQLGKMVSIAEEAFGLQRAGGSNEPVWRRWSDSNWVKQKLNDEGFTNVSVSKVVHTASLDSADQVVRLATESSPFLDTSKVPPEKLGNARQKFKEALALSYDSPFMLLTASNIITARLKLEP